MDIELSEKWIDVATAHYAKTKKMPIIVGIPIYECLGEACEIVTLDEHEGVIETVVVMNSAMITIRTDFENLRLVQAIKSK